VNFSSFNAFGVGTVFHAFLGCMFVNFAAAAPEGMGEMSVDRLAAASQLRVDSWAMEANSVRASDLVRSGYSAGLDSVGFEREANADDWVGADDDFASSRSLLAQPPYPQDSGTSPGSSATTTTADDALPLRGPLEAYGQAVLLQENADTAGRLRGTVFYPLSDQWLLGAEADLTFGDSFSGDGGLGARLNELYAAYAPETIPELRFVAGLIDFTSYFDRNSFAKDKTTHFFNPVFETSPALSAAGIDSKPGVLVNWSPVDAVEFKAVGFSSSRELGDLALDSVAAEAGLRWGNAIVRGTYSNSLDGGRGDGFEEIFQFNRGDGRFGLKDGDREEAYGVNGELFIPSADLGLFARYGYYRNLKLGEGGDTFSFGLNWFDLGREGSRLGLGYGRELSQSELRRDLGDKRPDVLELFYDIPIATQARAAVSLQQREEFSETVLGVRVKRLF